MNNKGVALYMVLTVLLIVVILANVVLNLIASQSRLTHHQVRRIQAYYAAQSGMNYALEALRNNDSGWATTSAPITRIMCRGVTGFGPCTASNLTPPNVTEGDLPPAINFVQITIGPFDVINSNRAVTAVANYSSY